MTDQLDGIDATDQTDSPPPLTPAQSLARSLLVYTEDRADFERLYAEHEQAVQPRDAIEFGLLDDLVANRWRIERVRAVETCALQTAVQDYRPRRSRNAPPPAPIPSISPATRDLLCPANPVLAQLSRLESRLQQRFGQALRQLKSWRTVSRASATGATAPQPAPDAPRPGEDTPAPPGTGPSVKPAREVQAATQDVSVAAPASATPVRGATNHGVAPGAASVWGHHRPRLISG